MTQLSTLEAAATWRDRALLADQAVFSDEPVWTMDNLRSLWVVLRAPDTDLQRLENLGGQLAEADPAAVRLAAELYWVGYLAVGPACLSHARKTDIVRTVYEWSGQTLPPSHPLLKDMTSPEECSPGLFFNARRGEELRFLVRAVVAVKKRSDEERRALLADPWATGRLLDEAAGEQTPQLNHILRYLLFPEHFEPVYTRRDKRRVVESFGGIPRREVRRWTVTRLDEELASIRKQLQPLYGDQPLSFLQEPLVSTWRPGGRAETGCSEQRCWVEKTDLASRPDRQSGPCAVGCALWSPQQADDGDVTPGLLREVEPGDLVLHLTDNEGITGISVVAAELDEAFVCPEGSPWAGQPGYQLALADHAQLEPMLSQSALLLDSRFQDSLRGQAGTHRLFFNAQLTLNRGHYLSEAPETLVRIFQDFYRQETSQQLPHIVLPDQADLPSLAASPAAKTAQQPLAQILAGPTGTGKTFGAMVRAVEICDGSAPGNHDQLMARYRELVAAERIRLVTFHPSFGYRDFIEDTHRISVRDPDTGERSTVEAVKPGVLKTMALRAGTQIPVDVPDTDFSNRTIWKVTPCVGEGTDTETVFRDLLEGQFVTCPEGNGIDFSGCRDRMEVSKRLKDNKPSGRASDEAVSAVDLLVNQMNVDDLVLLVDGDAACRAVGRISADYQPRRQVGPRVYTQIRSVDWLVHHAEPASWRQITRKKFLDRSLYRLDASLLRMEELKAMLKRRETGPVNYVLIIDEIGHGDVAGIFGELVTLIDADKRIGGANELAVQLPVSGDPFSVPANLYLIGTLNTAEPIAADRRNLLNRRFELIELDPDPSLIRGDDQLGTIPDDEGGRIDLRALMTAINQRIELLAGRQHRLGQGFFMQVQSYSDLLRVVRSRVLPRLESLFDGDWRALQRVFGDLLADGRPNLPQVIGHESPEEGSLPGAGPEGGVFRYWFAAEPQAFRKVYDRF